MSTDVEVNNAENASCGSPGQLRAGPGGDASSVSSGRGTSRRGKSRGVKNPADDRSDAAKTRPACHSSTKNTPGIETGRVSERQGRTKSKKANPHQTSLEAAQEYRRLGISCIPIRPGTKLPAVLAWAEWQEDLPSERDIDTWFEVDPKYGVALIMGRVSGGLACRDFDDMDAYEEWAQAHPEFAATLPTVATGRGRHVYFTLTETEEEKVRQSLGKKGGHGAIKLDRGELRIGASYAVAPPSIHSSGHAYQWINPFEGLRSVDPFAAGLVELPGLAQPEAGPIAQEHQRDQRTHKTCPQVSLVSLVQIDHPGVAEAIHRCLPMQFGRRHDRLFELARELQGLPEIGELPGTAFKQVVKEWHRQALPHIKNAKSFDENWMDFLEGWDKVRSPKGKSPEFEIMRAALEGPFPPEADQFEDDLPLRQLTSMSKAMQLHVGKTPFFLPSRLVAGLLYPGEPVETMRQLVSKRLRHLEKLGILRLVSQGGPSNREANRYHYLPLADSLGL